MYVHLCKRLLNYLPSNWNLTETVYKILTSRQCSEYTQNWFDDHILLKDYTMEKGQKFQFIGFFTKCLTRIKTKGLNIKYFFHIN